MSDNFAKIELSESFNIKKLITLFYMEIGKDFSYKGESHDFWEMVYIDKGDMICTAGKKQFVLKSGELTFHRPNEFHNLSGNGRANSNISILTFECFDKEMEFFYGKIFKLNSEEKSLLSGIFSEGRAALSIVDEKNPLIQKMKINPSAQFGYSQVIKNFIEIFLIKLRRNTDNFLKDSRRQFFVDGVNIPIRIKVIIDYLRDNIYGRITIRSISEKIGVSESALKKEFSMYWSGGIINYYNKLKVEEAKTLIRNGTYSFTQIADMLAFDTPQYFTKFFKNMTGMTPTEYKHSIIS